MPELLNAPISRAVALTAIISGICSIWLIGDRSLEIPISSQEVHAQISLIDQQRQAIAELQLRMSRIESEFDRYSSVPENSGVQTLIEGLRVDLEDLRYRRTASPDLPLPIAHYVTDEADKIGGLQTEGPTVLQEFELRTKMFPEAICLVQGASPGGVISVEILDDWNRWIEVYSGPDLSHSPTSETWVECKGSPSTSKIRVTVAGEGGVEAIGIAVSDTVHWSMASN